MAAGGALDHSDGDGEGPSAYEEGAFIHWADRGPSIGFGLRSRYKPTDLKVTRRKPTLHVTTGYPHLSRLLRLYVHTLEAIHLFYSSEIFRTSAGLLMTIKAVYDRYPSAVWERVEDVI